MSLNMRAGLLVAACCALGVAGCGGSGPSDVAEPPVSTASNAAPTVAAAAPTPTVTPTATAGGPFVGTWYTGGGGTAEGDTTLVVDSSGRLSFRSTLQCQGTVTPGTGGKYTFAFDCGTSKFSGTAVPPTTTRTFTMTWSEGDTSEFHAR